MKKIFLTIILSLAGLCLWAEPSLAISVDELQQQIDARQAEIAKLEQQVAAYKQKLGQTQAEKNTLANQIYIMETQIGKLRIQIQLTQEQILSTVLSIQDLQFKIQQQEIDIQKNKDNLTIILRSIYEYDNQSTLEMMLGNKNFSDFLNQAQYIQSLQSGIQEKVTKLKELKDLMSQQKQQQEQHQVELQELQNVLRVNQRSLNGQVDEKESLLIKTKGQEKQYQSILNDLIAKKSAFSKEIQELERQIVAAQNYLLHVQSGQIPPAGTKIFMWPEDSPVLTQGYGMTSFAKQGAYGGAPHNGIDMSDGYGSQIKAIAPGEILVKGYNKGWGNWIAVKHTNNMVSLYAHMKSASTLSIGSQVETGDTIGYEGSTGFSTGSHLHLSVYYEFFTYQKGGELYFNYFDGTLNPLNYL